MVAGIGVDIVKIGRFRAWQKDRGLIGRFFHADECAACGASALEAGKFLAGRFACKEAFGKALGTGMRGLRLSDIRVLNGESGRPEISLFSTAKAALEKSGARRVHVSLAHDGEYAVAFVVHETD
jgi:holo-[acyl-carrier protein] synthase